MLHGETPLNSPVTLASFVNASGDLPCPVTLKPSFLPAPSVPVASHHINIWLVSCTLYLSPNDPVLTSQWISLLDLLVLHVLRLHGIPEDIVFGRGPQFSSQLWKAFCQALGAMASLSSLPSSDKQPD